MTTAIHSAHAKATGSDSEALANGGSGHGTDDDDEGKPKDSDSTGQASDGGNATGASSSDNSRNKAKGKKGKFDQSSLRLCQLGFSSFFWCTGNKKWVPLEIGPPPLAAANSKLRNRTVTRGNSSGAVSTEYYATAELLANGGNGDEGTYSGRGGKYERSGNRERNRSLRRRGGGPPNHEGGYGAKPFRTSPPPHLDGAAVPGAVVVDASRPSKTGAILPNAAIVPAASGVAMQAQPLLISSALPQLPYRRNTGPRGRPRGGGAAGGGGVGGGRGAPLHRSRSSVGDPTQLDSIDYSTLSLEQQQQMQASAAYFYSGTDLSAGQASPGVVTSSAIAGAVLPPGSGVPVETTVAGQAGVGPTFIPATTPAAYYYNATSFLPTYDPDTLKECLRAQIEYYFSEDNLQGDFFLRRKMDEHGFLPISLIASFHRVQALTQDVSLVVESLANSTAVEVVDGIKVRTRDSPTKWPIVSFR